MTHCGHCHRTAAHQTSARYLGALAVAIWGLETNFGGDTGHFQTLRVLEGNKFLSEAFEDRIDTGRKQVIIACLKLRDFRTQLTGAIFAVRRSFHSRILRTGACVSAASRKKYPELTEIGM
jgi:hypothetical protein